MIDEEKYAKLYHEYIFGIGVNDQHPSEAGFNAFVEWRKKIEKCLDDAEIND